MFKNFVKDSFFFTKKYYGYLLGILAVSVILIIIMCMIYLIVGFLLALVIGFDLSTLKLLNDVQIIPYLSNKITLYIILMILLFIVLSLVILSFVQYPVARSLIEITRDKNVNRRPFDIYFSTVKEKNLKMGLKLIGLGLLLGIIVGLIFIIGMLLIAWGIATSNSLLRVLLFILGILGVLLSIYFLLRLMFSYAALVDKNLGIIESLKESIKLTNKRIGFIIATVLYSALLTTIIQIVFYIVQRSLGIESNESNILIILIVAIIYFLIIPYFLVIQFLPYNILLNHSNEDEFNERFHSNPDEL